MKARSFVLVALFAFAMQATAWGQSSDYHLPVLANETWRCEQGNADDPSNTAQNPNPTHRSSNSMKFAWDFNWGAGSDDDLYKPFLAPRSGIVSAVGYNTGRNFDGWGWYVIIQFSDGKFGKAAHMAMHPFVKRGEEVQQGQVLGLVGGTPNWPIHIHWQEQEDGTLSGQSTASGFSEVSRTAPVSSIRSVATTGVPAEDQNYISENIYLFDLVYTAVGGSSAFGQTIEINEYGWHDSWTSNNFANVYMTHPNTSINGGTLANPHIIYDAMRGAKNAVLIYGDMFEEWEDLGGPNSYLAAPIDTSYTWSSYTVQDCQGGYLRWNGSITEDFPYPDYFGPGAFDPSGGFATANPDLLLQNLPQGSVRQLAGRQLLAIRLQNVLSETVCRSISVGLLPMPITQLLFTNGLILVQNSSGCRILMTVLMVIVLSCMIPITQAKLISALWQAEIWRIY